MEFAPGDFRCSDAPDLFADVAGDGDVFADLVGARRHERRQRDFKPDPAAVLVPVAMAIGLGRPCPVGLQECRFGDRPVVRMDQMYDLTVAHQGLLAQDPLMRGRDVDDPAVGREAQEDFRPLAGEEIVELVLLLEQQLGSGQRLLRLDRPRDVADDRQDRDAFAEIVPADRARAALQPHPVPALVAHPEPEHRGHDPGPIALALGEEERLVVGMDVGAQRVASDLARLVADDVPHRGRDIGRHAVRLHQRDDVGDIIGDELGVARGWWGGSSSWPVAPGRAASELTRGRAGGPVGCVARDDDELGDLAGRRVDDRVQGGFQPEAGLPAHAAH